MTADNPKAFRQALGAFPTGVAIVATIGRDGNPVGITINSFTSISLEPRLVLWSLRCESTNFEAFHLASHFSINILSAGQAGLCQRFSSQRPDKFDGAQVVPGLAGIPTFGGCISVFECAKHGEIPAGDHVMFLGKVERFTADPALQPLVFCRGAFIEPAWRV